jgi:predicted nucleic acid-binding Zn ribbon protein
VDEVLAQQGWQERSQVAVLMAEWSRIVGSEVADHVRPETFEDGELLLRAESTSWATQMRLLLPQLQRALDQEVGGGVVRRIVVQGPQAPTWSAGKRRVKGRGPRDTYG